MRIKICLQLSNEGENLLSTDYQDSLSRNINEVLIMSTNSISELYPFQKTEIYNPSKLPFTFSNLFFQESSSKNGNLLITDPQFHFFLSFMPTKGLENVLPEGFAKKNFVIGNKKNVIECYVTDVQIVKEPTFTDSMSFKSLSPLVICYRDHTANIYSEYMFPKGERYNELFLNDISNKFAYYEKLNSISKGSNEIKIRNIEMLSKSTAKSVIFKHGTPEQIDYKGYFFDFKIHAPAELLRIAYYAGFGELNSLGFGCCDVL